MNIDAELDGWRRQWVSEPHRESTAVVVDELRLRVRRDTRWLKVGLIAPVLVTLGIGGYVAARALRSQDIVDLVVAGEGWLFIMVMWIGSLWIARGTWRPLADTTAAFVDISIRRCHADARGASFGACVYVLQLLFMLVVKILGSAAGLLTVLSSPSVILLGWVGLPLYLAWMVWFRRQRRAWRERLLELTKEL